MKRIISILLLIAGLLIISPDSITAQTKHKSKARTSATKHKSSKSTYTISWIDDIPSPKSLMYAWEKNGIKPALLKNLEKALEAKGYHEIDYSYCKSGVACIEFTGGRYEFDVFVAIPDDNLRKRYYDAAMKTYGSNKEFMINIEDDQVQICHLLLE